jgi:hypothetical protein
MIGKNRSFERGNATHQGIGPESCLQVKVMGQFQSLCLLLLLSWEI